MTAPTHFDWAGRYAEQHTPWDLGEAHPELVARVAEDSLGVSPPGRAFVPGCGRGHDAIALAAAGWTVVAVDVVPALAPVLEPRLRALGGDFYVADALGFDVGEPCALFFEHTFFCALDPADRPRWGELARRSVAPGGRLAALVFPADRPREREGPPWRTEARDLAAALGDPFRLVEEAPVRRRVARREWEERWALFERHEG